MFKVLPLEPRRYQQFAIRAGRRLLGKSTPPQSVDLSADRTENVSERMLPAEFLSELPKLDFKYLVEDDKRLLRVIVFENGQELFDAIVQTAERLGLRCVAANGRTSERIFSTAHGKAVLNESDWIRFYISPGDEALEITTISLEVWSPSETGGVQGPTRNRWVTKIWDSNSETLQSLTGATNLKSAIPGPLPYDPGFDIDYVFSWVDSEDPDWRKLFEKYRPQETSDASSASRFVARNDLKYALRSVEKYAPWVRRIYVLTNCAKPKWLKSDSGKLVWVDHTEVFDESELPTFNSHAIEATLHRIPGLAEHFIYSNDDFFLMRPTGKADFFYANGIARTRLEPYGMVNGKAKCGQPDYLNGALNSANLIFDEFDVFPTQLHTHSPQSLRRSVLEELENKYVEQFAITRKNRFRAVTDIAVPGFFASHYGFLTGRAVPNGGKTRLIQQNHNFEDVFKGISHGVRQRGDSRYLSVCVNDGNNSHENEAWNTATSAFLESVFPEPSAFER